MDAIKKDRYFCLLYIISNSITGCNKQTDSRVELIIVGAFPLMLLLPRPLMIASKAG